MSEILALGLMLIGGYWSGRLLRRLGLPSVTGYLLLGILIGPHGPLALLPNVLVHDRLEPITDLVLGVVAFSVGGQLSGRNLKRHGLGILAIALLESLGAFTLVFVSLHYLVGADIVLSLLAGAISSATAPAATIAVIKEFRARGPLTDTILAVVALDDAVAIIIFGVATAIAGVIGPGKGISDPMVLLMEPTIEVFGSIVLGFVAGFILSKMSQQVQQRPNQIALVLGSTLVVGGTATVLHCSALLSNMAAGACIASFSPYAARIFNSLRDLEASLFIAFFVLAGAHLRFDLLASAGLMGGAYLLARGLGKLIGAWLGCRIAGSPPLVRANLGFALLPQAGVAIGLAFVARTFLPPDKAALLATVILATVAINEFIGPLTAKIAITRAGEATVLGGDRDDDED